MELKEKNLFASIGYALALYAVALFAIIATGCAKDDQPKSRAQVAPTPGGSGNGAPVDEGVEYREHFIRDYQGSFEFPDHKGTIAGLSHGKEKLVIHPAGNYELTLNDITADADAQRVVKCSVEERGTVESVRRSGNSGKITLYPKTAIVTKAQTLVREEAQGITRDATSEEELPTEQINALCLNQDAREIQVKDFLFGALLLEGPESEDPRNFLNPRLAVKEGTDWLWLTGSSAKQAFAKLTEIANEGAPGLNMFGTNVGGSVNADGGKTLIVKMGYDAENPLPEQQAEKEDDRSVEEKAGDAISGAIRDLKEQVTGEQGNAEMPQHSEKIYATFGTMVESKFVPFMEISGHLEGISYNHKTGQAVLNLTHFESATNSANLGSTGMNRMISREIEKSRKDVEESSTRITNMGRDPNRVLMIDLSTINPGKVNVNTKLKGLNEIIRSDANVPKSPLFIKLK